MTDNTVPQKTTQAENIEPSFTPGPWTHCCDACRVVMSAHNPIADITSGLWGDEFPSMRPLEGSTSIEAKFEAYMEKIVYGEVDRAEAIANAHLIAAAPDMYEALKGILDHETRRRENVTAHLTIENMQARNQLIEEKATVFRNACSALLKARGGK